MFIKVDGSPAAFKKVQASHKNKYGTVDLSLANARPIEGKQTERLIDVLTGKPKEEGKGRPDVPPEELEWRYILRKTDAAGQPTGDPLDITQTPVSQGLKSGLVLYICLAAEFEAATPTGGDKKPPPNSTGDKKPPPNPTGGDKKPPPNPTGDKKPPPNPTGDKKPPPNPTGAKKPEPPTTDPEGDKKPSTKPKEGTSGKKPPTTSSDKKPSKGTRTPPPNLSGVGKSPTASPSDNIPQTSSEKSATIRTRSPVREAAGSRRERSPEDSDTINLPSPDDDIVTMREKMRYYQQQIDKTRDRIYSENDSHRRRRGIDDAEDESIQRQREMIHLNEKDRLIRLEDQLRQKENDMQRREKELRWREDQAEDERKRALLSSPMRSLNTVAVESTSSAVAHGEAAGVLQSLQNLHLENRELRNMVAELKQKQLLQQHQQDSQEPLSPKSHLHRTLLDAGLSHFESHLQQNQLDRESLQLATPSDLTEIGMTENEAQRLLNSIRVMPSHFQSPRRRTSIENSAMMPKGSPPRMSEVTFSRHHFCAEDIEFHKSVLGSFFSRYDPSKITSISQVVQDLMSSSSLDQFYPALVSSYNLEHSPYTEKVAHYLDVGRHSAAVILCDVWKGREGELLHQVTGVNPKWTEYTDNDRCFYYSETFNLSQWIRPAMVSKSEHQMLAVGSYAASVSPHRELFLPHGMEGHQRSGSSPHRQLKKTTDHYRAWSIAFFLKHDPSRVSEADNLLSRYSGPELVEILTQQYAA